jgi:hypothetical protein
VPSSRQSKRAGWAADQTRRGDAFIETEGGRGGARRRAMARTIVCELGCGSANAGERACCVAVVEGLVCETNRRAESGQ